MQPKFRIGQSVLFRPHDVTEGDVLRYQDAVILDIGYTVGVMYYCEFPNGVCAWVSEGRLS